MPEQAGADRGRIDYELKVILTLHGNRQRVSNVPLRYHNDDQSSNKILAKPILDHICHLGKNLNGMEIQYHCEEDNINEMIGVYGQSIVDDSTIDMDDLKKSGNKIHLELHAI